jgi:hypothetical protein
LEGVRRKFMFGFEGNYKNLYLSEDLTFQDAIDLLI